MEVKIQENIKGRTILGNLDQIKSILFELIRNSTKALQRSKALQNSDGIIEILADCQNDGLLESTPDIIRGASTSEPDVKLSPQSAPS